MWIKLTSRNEEPVYVRAEDVEVIEGLPAEGPTILFEAKKDGGARIVTKAGASLGVLESVAEVLAAVTAGS